MTTDTLLTVGALLADRYEIESVLAADLFAALDRRLDLRLVIKVRPAREGSQLSREFLALRQLAHQGARRVFDFGEAHAPGGAVAFYSMEPLVGEHLAARVARSPLSRVEARRLVAAVARGLSAARAVGLGPGGGGLEPEQVWTTTAAEPRTVLSGLTLGADAATCVASARLERMLVPGKRRSGGRLALVAVAALLLAAGAALTTRRSTGQAGAFAPAPFLVRGEAADAPRAFVISGPFRQIVEGLARDSSGGWLMVGNADHDAFLGATHVGAAEPVAPIAFASGLGPDGTVKWLRRFTAELGVTLHAVAPAGDAVVVAGQVAGAIELDGQRQGTPNRFDCLIASLDRITGATRWMRTCGSLGASSAHAVVVDGAGNIYAVGVGGGLLGDEATPVNEPGVFVLSYAPDGALRWRWSTSGSSRSVVASAAAIVGDELIVGGAFTGSLRLGGERVTATGQDAFLIGFGLATGAPRFTHVLGGRGRDGIYALAPGQAGEVIMAGELGETDLGPAPSPAPLASTRFNAVVAALEPRSARARWLRRFPARGNASLQALALAGDGRILATGAFQLGLDVGNAHLGVADTDYDGFVVELDGDGRVLAHAQLGGALLQRPAAIMLDGDRLWIAGEFRSHLDAGTLELTSTDMEDGFVLDLPAAWLTAEAAVR